MIPGAKALQGKNNSTRLATKLPEMATLDLSGTEDFCWLSAHWQISYCKIKQGKKLYLEAKLSPKVHILHEKWLKKKEI